MNQSYIVWRIVRFSDGCGFVLSKNVRSHNFYVTMQFNQEGRCYRGSYHGNPQEAREDFRQRVLDYQRNRTEKPDVTLNTEDETINTTPDMEYSTDGGHTWNPCTEPMDVSGLPGQTILIRDKGDEDSFPSEGVTIVIPVRRDAPKIIVDNHAETVSSDKGTEISFNDGKTWKSFDEPLETAE